LCPGGGEISHNHTLKKKEGKKKKKEVTYMANAAWGRFNAWVDEGQIGERNPKKREKKIGCLTVSSPSGGDDGEITRWNKAGLAEPAGVRLPAQRYG